MCGGSEAVERKSERMGIAGRHPIDGVVFNYKCGDFCKMRDDEERKEGHGDDKASEGGP